MNYNNNSHNSHNVDAYSNSQNNNSINTPQNALKTFLTSDNLSTLKILKSYKNPQNKKFSSLSFDDSGEYLLSTSEDNNLMVFNCLSGSLDITQGSKKYGCNLGRFTHYNKNILFGSTMENDTVRYLSLEESKFIAYFIGHTNKVISLEMAPFDDHFLTSSFDKTIRLWDLRSHHCQALIHNQNPHYITFEPNGRIFATLEPITSSVHLYDLRSLGRGPFQSIPLNYPTPSPNLSGIKFSPDSKKLLISGDADYNILVDSFSGNCQYLRRTLSTPCDGNLGEDSTFTPDGKFIIGCGNDSQGGTLEIFNLDQLTNNNSHNGNSSPNYLESIQKLRIGSAEDIPRICKFNPRRFQLASGCNEVNFWLPDVGLIERNQQQQQQYGSY